MKRLKGNRTDLFFEQEQKSLTQNVMVSSFSKNSYQYSTLSFFTIDQNLKHSFKQELQLFLKENKYHHVFIVGLGSDNHTADSVGPKVLRYIKANAYLEYMGISLTTKISLLEPGVLGETGIETRRIVESVVDEIKPDLIIFIDSYLTEDIDHLNHTIEINNRGITPGSGIRGLNEEMNEKTVGVPVIVIGIPTALEIGLSSFQKENFTYHLSTSDIDTYVDHIAKLIGTSIQEILNHNFDNSTPL